MHYSVYLKLHTPVVALNPNFLFLWFTEVKVYVLPRVPSSSMLQVTRHKMLLAKSPCALFAQTITQLLCFYLIITFCHWISPELHFVVCTRNVFRFVVRWFTLKISKTDFDQNSKPKELRHFNKNPTIYLWHFHSKLLCVECTNVVI